MSETEQATDLPHRAPLKAKGLGDEVGKVTVEVLGHS